jgi:uncharacterized protein (DUF3084 family)
VVRQLDLANLQDCAHKGQHQVIQRLFFQVNFSVSAKDHGWQREKAELEKKVNVIEEQVMTKDDIIGRKVELLEQKEIIIRQKDSTISAKDETITQKDQLLRQKEDIIRKYEGTWTS